MLRGLSSFSSGGGNSSSRSVRRYEGAPIRVLTFTWNVGNKMPKKEELHLWCPKDGGNFDLVVVGTQENSFTEKKKKKKKTGAGLEENSLAQSSDVELEDDDEDAIMEQRMKEEEEAEEEAARLSASGQPPLQRTSRASQAPSTKFLHLPHEAGGKQKRGKRQTARCDRYPAGPWPAAPIVVTRGVCARA